MRKKSLEEIVYFSEVSRGPAGYRYRIVVHDRPVALVKDEDYAQLFVVVIRRIYLAKRIAGHRLAEMTLVLVDFLTSSTRILNHGIRRKQK